MVRIRKHAPHFLSCKPPSSPPPPSASASRAPLVLCELNLSPWDVTPFTPQTESDYQVKIENDFALYTSDNVGELPDATSNRCSDYMQKEARDVEDVVESLSMLNVVTKRKVNKSKKKQDDNYVRCVKKDGKSWQCKKEAQQGEELCTHHLVQLKSYQNKYYPSTKKPKPSAPKKARAGTSTTVVANKKRNSRRVQTKPADYYYYSGFGPTWGKRRRGGEITQEEIQVINDAIENESSSLSSPSLGANQEKRTFSRAACVVPWDHDDMSMLYEFEDDDDDEEGEGDVGKKRARKPIKARSLKSLF